MNKRILILDGGTRNKGTTNNFCNEIKLLANKKEINCEIFYAMEFYRKKLDIEQIITLISNFDILLVVIPCYECALPYPTIALFEEISSVCKDRFAGKECFCIAHGGLLYEDIIEPILHSCEYFCDHVMLRWKGGVIITNTTFLNGAKLSEHKYGAKLIPILSDVLNTILSGSNLSKSNQKGINPRLPKIIVALLMIHLNKKIKKRFGIKNFREYQITTNTT